MASLFSALFAGVCLSVSGSLAAAPLPEPPAEWREHVAAIRAAEAVEGLEDRCKAYPDLPDNQWRAGSAQARCTLLRKPLHSLDSIAALLATPQGVARLEQDYAGLLQAHYDDPARRNQIYVSLDIFGDSPRAGEVSRLWLDAAPDSPFALVAAGQNLYSQGMTARGGEYIDKTPPENIRAMKARFTKAVPLFQRALELEPRLGAACLGLYDIGSNVAPAMAKEALRQCLSADPDSYHVILTMLYYTKPRWGGSFEKMRQVTAYASARTDDNPILGALLGEALVEKYMMAELENPDDADALAAAGRLAPSGTILAKAGKGYSLRGNDPWRALVYLSQGIRFWPKSPSRLYSRAIVLSEQLGDTDWAQADLTRALALEPDNAKYHYLMGVVMTKAGSAIQARPHLQIASQQGDNRRFAAQMYCHSYSNSTLSAQVFANCTEKLVATYPEYAQPWMLRAMALYQLEDPAVVEAIDQVLKLGDPNSPVEADAMKDMRLWRQEPRFARPALQH